VANRLYSNIATLSGGLPAWRKANYSLDTTKKLPDATIPEITKEQFKKAIGTDVNVACGSKRGRGSSTRVAGHMRPDV